MVGYMLDTNLFNKLVDSEFAIETLENKRVVVTHVQRDELARTTNNERSGLLLAAFNEIDPEKISTRTSIWGDTLWGQGNWSDEDGLYEKMLVRLKELDAASGKKPEGLNQSRDVRIAETAIKNDLTLVTEDQNLRQVTSDFGGNAIGLELFVKQQQGRLI